MSRLSLVAAVLAGLAGLAACGPDGASAHPDASARGTALCDLAGEYAVGGVRDDVIGDVRMLANGLPVWKGYGFIAQNALGGSLGTTLTPALVSGENTAAVEVVPAVSEAGTGPAVGPVRLRLWVCAPDGAVVPGTERSAAHVDSVVAAWTAELESRWAAWGAAAADSARAWAEAHPVRVETSFTRPAGADGRPADGEPAFDAVVREAPVIGGTPADSARLRAYAVELLRMSVERDTVALWRAFEPAISDNWEVLGGVFGAGMSWDDYEVGNREAVVFEQPTPFDASDVQLQSWAGGRVWELYRNEAGGLIQNEGRGLYQEIYVGEVDGELRVVRVGL